MPPLRVLTLVIGADFRKGLAECLESKRDWCVRQGYDYIEGGEEHWDRSKPIPWSKVGFVLSKLEKATDGDLFFLSDADVLITNPAIRLEDSVVPLLPAEKDLLICIDACGHLNSGNMLMRNSPWLRNFWRRVGEQKELTYHIWWENAAIIKLLELNSEDFAKTEITGLRGEHKLFNAYLQGIKGEPLWAPGDLLVHFAGIYDTKKMAHLVSEIKKKLNV